MELNSFNSTPLKVAFGLGAIFLTALTFNSLKPKTQTVFEAVTSEAPVTRVAAVESAPTRVSTPTPTPTSTWTQEEQDKYFHKGDHESKFFKTRVVRYTSEQMGKVNRQDVATITKALKEIKWSKNMDSQAAAQEDFDAIKAYCDTHSNLSDGASLIAALVTQTDGSYAPGNKDLRNKYETAMDDLLVANGRAKAEARVAAREDAQGRGSEALHQSAWDGSIRIVDDYIKSRLDDPDSYKFVQATKPWMSSEGWEVRYVFRAKNRFGGVTTSTAVVVISDNQVVSLSLN